MSVASLALFALLGSAHAYVDAECQEVAAQGTPSGYSEQGQQDFLLNYFALATTLSPLHGAVPHLAGHGSVSLDLGIIPPLSCERRLVLDYTKTEDTNKSPIVPRPRFIFSFPEVGKWTPYAGVAYAPPVKVFGTRNVIMSGEAGIGRHFGKSDIALGVRYHATLMKTVAEIATPFVEGDPAIDDFYMGSTFGMDFIIGKDWDGIEPYLAIGMTDASTFFYIGDDAVVGNNYSPYFGPTTSLGVDVKKVKSLDLVGEFYMAPGYLYTGRMRVGYRW